MHTPWILDNYLVNGEDLSNLLFQVSKDAFRAFFGLLLMAERQDTERTLADGTSIIVKAGTIRTTWRELTAHIGGSINGVRRAVGELETLKAVSVKTCRDGTVVCLIGYDVAHIGGITYYGFGNARHDTRVSPGDTRNADSAGNHVSPGDTRVSPHDTRVSPGDTRNGHVSPGDTRVSCGDTRSVNDAKHNQSAASPPVDCAVDNTQWSANFDVGTSLADSPTAINSEIETNLRGCLVAAEERARAGDPTELRLEATPSKPKRRAKQDGPKTERQTTWDASHELARVFAWLNSNSDYKAVFDTGMDTHHITQAMERDCLTVKQVEACAQKFVLHHENKKLKLPRRAFIGWLDRERKFELERREHSQQRAGAAPQRGRYSGKDQFGKGILDGIMD